MANKKKSLLSKAEEFYIENNLNKTDEELAEDLGKSVASVRTHIHNTQGESRIKKLLISNKKKGYTIMTEGASTASDQAHNHPVNQQLIREAVARGDYEEAGRLQGLMKQQLRDTDDTVREANSKYIHYVDKIEPDNPHHNRR